MEQWKTINRLPNYEISTTGKIRNIKKGNELKVVTNNAGYKLVCLSYKNKKHTGYIHRLLAETFIPTDLNKETSVVNHIDQNRNNNDISNLEWTTPLGNYVHHRTKLDSDHLIEITNLLDKMDYDQVSDTINYMKTLLDK